MDLKTGATYRLRKALRLALTNAASRTCILCATAVALSIATASCSSTEYVKLRSIPRSPLGDQLKLTSRSGPQPSNRTMQVLRQHDLVNEWKGEPRALVEKFQAIVDRDRSAEKLYSLAELNFLGGKRVENKDEDGALDMYGAAVTNAYLYLFDERFNQLRNPYDPQFRGACDVYNGALENALRIVRKRGGLLPGTTHTVTSAGHRCDITIVVRGDRWQPEDFHSFEFANDYEVQGLTNQFQTYGLGVPLIAVHQKHEQTPPREAFFPPSLSFPVTAFLHVLPQTDPGTGAVSADAPTHRRAMLELYDPLASTDIVLNGRRVPLESDLSTPLAYSLNNPTLEKLATQGLLRPDKAQSIRGLYMLEPYEPGKIPVLMVHGLWSSPLTWMEMFNDLRSSPQIRENYQFWFYVYPTGQPFWASAAQLREDLTHVRHTLDPERREPAMDHMVLVGHSMGGLVSKLQTVDSGQDYWRIVSDRPFEEVQATPEVRSQLASMFFFKPNPSVRRVITIGTPHRGSKFANDTTRWLAHKLITLPERTMQRHQQLFRDNPGLFRDTSLCEIKTSIDSLAPSSPIFPVLLTSHRPAWVKYHNIVGVLPEKGLIGSIAGGTDGAVSYQSAHLDGVESELVINTDHLTVHRHPLSVLEVQRILLAHLDELRNYPGRRESEPYTAAVPGQPRPAAR